VVPLAAEYEAKVLDVDPAATTALIVSRGGVQVTPTTLQRRYVYDVTAADDGKWIRLRDTGHRVTLAVKVVTHDGIDGTEEVETTVDSFETTNALLGLIGFRPKSYQENRRTSFTLDGAQLEIDEWPMIPPYLEIEAATAAEVVRVAALLGYDETQLTSENTTKVYARYGIDLTQYEQVRFG
jgi:adenylate cyclase class 2